MTLGELIRLYKAEQEGKQVIMYESTSSDYGCHKTEYKVKLADMELSDFIREEEGVYVTFYIKGERDV